MFLEIQSDKENTSIENFKMNFMYINFSFNKAIILVNQSLINRGSDFGLNNVTVCATLSGIFECWLSCKTPDYRIAKKEKRKENERKMYLDLKSLMNSVLKNNI